MLHFIKNFLPHGRQDIIVFSHVRWNPAFKYPQQIITRLAKKRKIIFIEEPTPFQFAEDTATSFSPQKNVIVVQPHITTAQIKQELPLLIAKQIRQHKIRNPILWFYSSVFYEIIPYLNHSLVIYDNMSKQSIRFNVNEEYLFTAADIVFTSERIFYERKKQYMQNLYYLQADKKLLPQKFWDVTVRTMQQIIRKVFHKKLRSRHLVPSYYPLVSQLTTGG